MSSAEDADKKPTWSLAVGLSFSALAAAYVFFSGRYLPYYDLPWHTGLAAVLGTGHETGADGYFVRTWRPSPYLLFYAAVALLTKLGVHAEVGAKLCFCASAALWTWGAMRVCRIYGRDARMGFIGSIAMFGGSLGRGFGSFVFAQPLILFAIADFELLLRKPSPRRAVVLSLVLSLAFLGHGLVFLFATFFIAVRLAVHMMRSGDRWPTVVRLAGIYVLPILLALPTLIPRLYEPHLTPDFARMGLGPTDLAVWTSPVDVARALWFDTLDRGGRGHEVTAWLLVGLSAVWWALTVWSRPRWMVTDAVFGLLVGSAVAFTFFGPESLLWPVSFWLVERRMSALALLLVLLLPKPRLSHVTAALGLVVVAHNAWANGAAVRSFNERARGFSEVRARVPQGARVLPLNDGTVPYVGGLPWLLLADGVAFMPIHDVPTETPVHRKDPNHPAAPRAAAFRAARFGNDYDFVLLLGRKERRRLDVDPALHRVGESGPWTLYRLADPAPRPTE